MKRNVFSLVLWSVLFLWQQSHAQQTDISVNNDPGQCSAIITYTAPETTYQDPIPPHTLTGYNTIGFKDGNYYYISQTEETAADSYANAHNLNAYVATVPNADVNQFLANYLSTNNIASAEIGFSDVNIEGTFVWDSGNTSTYTNWAAGEPNNVNNEDYTELYSNGYWNDYPETTTIKAIIEKAGQPFELLSGPASGDPFPIGLTQVIYKGIDNTGEAVFSHFNVTVTDNEAPQFTNYPNDITVDVDSGSCGALVNYTTPTASDNCDTNSYYVALSEHTLNDLNDWTIIYNGGDGWTINSDNHFQTSYAWNSKTRVIDLLSLNYDPEVLDTSPDIIVSEKYQGGAPNYSDTYKFIVRLLDANGNELDSFNSGLITTTSAVQTISHTFSGYPSGVRQIVIEDGGRDAEGWAGHYGSIMYGTQIQIQNKVLVKQITGLAAGDTYPVGTTTNEYQAKDLAGNLSNCIFDVTVTDNELPVVNCPGNQTIDLQANQTIYTLPDYISNGDVTAGDNCNVVNVTQTPAAGTDLNAGTYQINFEAADPSGNTQTCSFELVINEANGINENHRTNKIKLYPNPAKNTINLEVAENININKIDIYDITGRKLHSVTYNKAFKNKPIIISKLTTGKYFMHLQTDSGLYVKQFLVNK